MAKISWKVPDLTGDNINIEFITDELGKVKAALSVLKKMEKFYVEAWKARNEKPTIESDIFIAELSQESRLALDQTKAKATLEKLGLLAEHMVESAPKVLRVSTKMLGSPLTKAMIMRILEEALPDTVQLEKSEGYQG